MSNGLPPSLFVLVELGSQYDPRLAPKAPMSYITTNISTSQGFHPVSTNIIHFTGSSPAQCSLHLYFRLPPLLFVDPHELAQRNSIYTFNHWGSRDLEKPVHALPDAERDSDILLNVRLPRSAEAPMWNMTVELPMHLRYGVPAPVSSISGSEKPYEHVRVDTPIAFMLCKTSREPLFGAFFIPFIDFIVLATFIDNATQIPAPLPSYVIASLTKTPQNTFILIPAHPEFSSTQTVITVPLGSISDLPLVELGTALTIILCFFWLALVSWNTSLRLARVRRQLKQE